MLGATYSEVNNNDVWGSWLWMSSEGCTSCILIKKKVFLVFSKLPPYFCQIHYHNHSSNIHCNVLWDSG